MSKYYICSIKKVPNTTNYVLEMYEMTKDGINHCHELKFTFNVYDNLSWEKEQIRHYFEYDHETPKVLCNNSKMLKHIFHGDYVELNV